MDGQPSLFPNTVDLGNRLDRDDGMIQEFCNKGAI
jgi:hypothetical protein